MKKFILLLLCCTLCAAAQDLGMLLQRAPGEIPYKVSPDCTVNIAADPTAWEILAAAEAVNRLFQETIEIPERFFSTARSPGDGLLILLRERLRSGDAVPEELREEISLLPENLALVAIYRERGRDCLLVCGKGKAVRLASLAFFGRYPYFSELLGPEVSATYGKVKSDLKEFTGTDFRLTRITYEFPDPEIQKKLQLDKFRFPPFGIVKLTAVAAPGGDLAAAKLRRLAENRGLGEDTAVLSFADIRSLEVRCGGATIVIPRSGSTLAEMTPAYKPFLKKKIKAYTASLESLLTTSGILADANEDGFPDALKSTVIVNPQDVTPELIDLAGNLSALLTGTSFPLFTLDSEVEDIVQLDFPVIYGPSNIFLKELLDRGKLGKQASGKSAIQILNNSLGPSPALVITDRTALAHLTSRFPSFQEFNWGGSTLAKSFARLKEYLTAAGGGDILYFRHLQKKLDPETLSGFFSDRFATAAIQKDLLPKCGPARICNESQTVKEWDLPIRSESVRMLEEIEKNVLPAITTGGVAKLEVRVSESPGVRSDLERKIAELLARKTGRTPVVEANSAYKFGYFYIRERVLPRLAGKSVDRVVIRAPLLAEDRAKPRRFRQDPLRWLMELYPVDELIAGQLGIPVERIELRTDEALHDAYAIEASSGGRTVLADTMPIFPYSRPYLSPRREWGDVQVAGGMVITTGAGGEISARPFPTDLEVFWQFYQDEVLPFLVDFIRKKTGNNPKLDNQPFFKQLKVEISLSEPDIAAGVDQELVSSLEAIHDEIYFDTLDLLAGILNIEKSDKQFNMRKSSPGNVLPYVRPSREGLDGSVKIALTDYASREPRLVIFKNGQESSKTFPDLSEVKIEMTGLEVAAGLPVGNVLVRCEKEAEFEALNGILASLEELVAAKRIAYPEALLGGIALETKFKENDRLFSIRTSPAPAPPVPGAPASIPEKILSPEETAALSRGFSGAPGFKVFSGGESLEKKDLPVIFAYDPALSRFSLAKLLLQKPTLFFSARQHANEVSSTTYVLQLLEGCARDPGYAKYRQRLNLLILPMENPDGAALAYELQELTPSHSLHAGRYTAKGVDVGYVQDDDQPSLPEALVRPQLNRSFKPDLYLNLHGYPSHEWVQPFSGYVPFLFRSYWIPKGMFLYFNYVNRREQEAFRKTGRELLDFLARGLAGLPGNQKFFRRYRRWSERWAPHLNYMDMEGGSLIFNRRENAGFQKPVPPILQLASETPELMDETAQGDWFKELLHQGQAYLRLHLDFFSGLENEFVTDHYSEGDRVWLLHKRLRPGRAGAGSSGRGAQLPPRDDARGQVAGGGDEQGHIETPVDRDDHGQD